MTAGPDTVLQAIKVVHTVIWAFFVLMILAVWSLAMLSHFEGAAWAASIVFIEVVVLALNRGECPLGPIVARRTADRRANFDIYLPEWLAARTKLIFGTLYCAGILFVGLRWLGVAP